MSWWGGHKSSGLPLRPSLCNDIDACLSFPKKFIITAHAQKRAAERQIDQIEFTETVLKPDNKRKQRHGEHGGIVYLFTKRFSNRELSISAEIFKDDCYFITGYWK
jgi:hypothetical protein